jgi:DeoR family transcriptional regulator, ulaG and ulaABCDEF operon transcriptional repressor
MHLAEREKVILECLGERGFVTLQDLGERIHASIATIRRDLNRLTEAGVVTRIHGGAKLVANSSRVAAGGQDEPSSHYALQFVENLNRNRSQKESIGREAAKLCRAREAVMISGGSTTLQMCAHLGGVGLQVLTNSLHIANELLLQPGIRVLVPGGQVYREQNVVFLPAGEDGMPDFHAPRLFMGAAAIGPSGVMQPSIVLVSAERRFVDRAKQIVLLADSSKFDVPSGHVVCALRDVDVLVTDAGISSANRKMLEDVGVQIIVAR